MNKEKSKKMNEKINQAIQRLEKATSIRLILNGEEFLHDFDQMDARRIKNEAVDILKEYLVEEKD